MTYCRYILPEHPRTSDTCVVPVGSTVTKKTFVCIRLINNWLCNSMLTDLLGNLAIIAVHDHAIFILKTDIRNIYMSIHPRGMMVSSLFY